MKKKKVLALFIGIICMLGCEETNIRETHSGEAVRRETGIKDTVVEDVYRNATSNSIDMKESIMQEISMSETTMEEADREASIMREIDLNETDRKESHMKETPMQETGMSETAIEEADREPTIMREIEMTETDRSATDLQETQSEREDSMRNDVKEPDLYDETGIASFISDEYDGEMTASGVRYDRNKMTAAHHSLSFDTKIVVTNLKNKRSVEVVIIDRFIPTSNRILNLSHGAAVKLDLVESGVAKVGIKVIPETDQGSN